MVELCIIYDKVRFEEKALYDKALKKGLKARIVDAKTITINTESNRKDFRLGDVVLQRSISHYRGLYLTACLEFLGLRVINKFKVGEICGNKLITSLTLAKHNIPTPKTHLTFSAESAMEVINSPLARIYYIQEMIKRPPRDIRCIVIGEKVVASIYRYSAENEWRTNVARGGKAEVAPITKELEDIALKAARVVGGGILGVDLMEDEKRGLLVHEVNNTVEFRGAANVSEADITGAIIDYATSIAKK